VLPGARRPRGRGPHRPRARAGRDADGAPERRDGAQHAASSGSPSQPSIGDRTAVDRARLMSDLGFGIVGTGMVARYHAQAIAETQGARLAAVCRANAEKVRDATEAFGVPCERSLEALLARRDVDVVSLCTPSGLHAAQAVAAARAGKHVLVEKPMALTLADADTMIAACR